jgi:hypothetical protein
MKYLHKPEAPARDKLFPSLALFEVAQMVVRV